MSARWELRQQGVMPVCPCGAQVAAGRKLYCSKVCMRRFSRQRRGLTLAMWLPFAPAGRPLPRPPVSAARPKHAGDGDSGPPGVDGEAVRGARAAARGEKLSRPLETRRKSHV